MGVEAGVKFTGENWRRTPALGTPVPPPSRGKPRRLRLARATCRFDTMSSRSIAATLDERFAAAIAQVAGSAGSTPRGAVRPAGDPRFGDYQCNAAMSLARQLSLKPREVAERIVSAANLDDLAAPPEVAGPGFINIRLKNEFLAQRLVEIPAPPAESSADRLGISPVDSPQRILIDYSAPNIAKQMHVGHLRSTIIGDALARVLGFQGHEVIRQNHVGDWGTQFGMLLAYYADAPIPAEDDPDALEKIENDYRTANDRFKTDATFATAARLAVGRLQSGDQAARELWQKLCRESERAFTQLYRRLGVLLEDSDVVGESFYNQRLAPVIAELRAKFPPRTAAVPSSGPYAEVRDDQGAVCLFLCNADGSPMFRNPDGAPLPMIIQKSDGAYLYATTDLAAMRYRTQELRARRVIYVVGSPTKLHLEMLFAAARRAGWAGPDVALEHVSFGQVLGADRKLLRTRTGGAVKLKDLLDEAERRAGDLLDQKLAEADDADRSTLTDAERRHIAARVAIGAVKYFDLARDRNSDYVFDWDEMLALQGNTAPYMLYAYARIRSIYRRVAERLGSPDVYDPSVRIALIEPAERALALRLLRFHDALAAVAADLTPHLLCTYLYDLAADFMRFYESCPVLAAVDEATRLSRLRLCDLTARTLRLGLRLLGIETIERM
jgi:arginyl-tRNA synthetase